MTIKNVKIMMFMFWRNVYSQKGSQRKSPNQQTKVGSIKCVPNDSDTITKCVLLLLFYQQRSINIMRMRMLIQHYN